MEESRGGKGGIGRLRFIFFLVWGFLLGVERAELGRPWAVLYTFSEGKAGTRRICCVFSHASGRMFRLSGAFCVDSVIFRSKI